MLMALLGLAIGTVGTLIGVGGGFILVPILLFLYPDAKTVWISGVSMAVVAANATSGSIAYWRAGKVHMRAGLVFILASIPGSILGVWFGQMVNRHTFELIFGTLMILFALMLLFRRTAVHDEHALHARSELHPRLYILGIVVSFFVGFLASFFGIGGGVIHVPLLSHVLGFPVHLAAGTSHFILAVTAWFTTLVHFYDGDISWREPILWELGGGAAVGAQLGAFLSPRVSAPMIMKILGVALLLVGIRIVTHG